MSEEKGFPVIELDFPLLGRVLTQYGHYIGHIRLADTITVESLAFDETAEVLTVFINLEKQVLN